jgi:hypothetical protein
MNDIVIAKDMEYDTPYTDGTRKETIFHFVKKNANAVYLVQSENKKYIENNEGLVAFDLQATFYKKHYYNETD